jgi:hypothetical protein
MKPLDWDKGFVAFLIVTALSIFGIFVAAFASMADLSDRQGIQKRVLNHPAGTGKLIEWARPPEKDHSQDTWRTQTERRMAAKKHAQNSGTKDEVQFSK